LLAVNLPPGAGSTLPRLSADLFSLMDATSKLGRGLPDCANAWETVNISAATVNIRGI